MRDLKFWFRQAQIKLLEDQLKRIQASRLSMARDTDYTRVVNELDRQLKISKIGEKEIIKISWEELRLMSKIQKRKQVRQNV